MTKKSPEDPTREPLPRFDFRSLACEHASERRLRSEFFGHKLFGEPAWDLLLALYCYDSEAHSEIVDGLRIGSDLPQSTILRWQKVLLHAGLVRKISGPFGVELSDEGKSLLEAYFRSLITNVGG